MDREKGLSVVGCILLVLGVAVIVFGGVLLQAYALTKLWSWFIVPIFDIPSLTIKSAYGLTLVVAMFQLGRNSQTNEQTKGLKGWAAIEDGFTRLVGVYLVAPVVVLAIGYAVHAL